MVKRQIDIESLVIFAFSELEKRFTSSSNSWDHIGWGRPQDPGHRTSRSSQRYAIGVPHPDADRVEKAIEALESTHIDWDSHLDEIMGELAPLFRAHNPIMVGSSHPSQLVRYHGIMKSRPDWGKGLKPMPSRIQPNRGPAGAPAVNGLCKGRDQYTLGAFCPLKWSPSPLLIAEKRGEFVVWHDALIRLAIDLEGRLEDFDPTAPECSGLPWVYQDASPRLLRDLISRPMSKLPEKYPRPLAGKTGAVRLGSGGPVRHVLA